MSRSEGVSLPDSEPWDASTVWRRLDPLLEEVTRPARYTGGEWNARRVPWESAEVRVALAYPDLYEIGMANLGLMILYDRLNRIPGVLADRVYSPWGDMEALLRREKIPLYGLESGRPLFQFDMLGISLPYELTYTNVLTLLDLGGIPLRSEERTAQHPLVVGGGSGAYNPEPMAPFFDLLVIGEGEQALEELVALFRESRAAGLERELFLRRAAGIPGVYVPRFYRVDYAEDGTVAAVAPRVEGVPTRIVKRVVRDLRLSPPVTRPVVPYVASVHDRAVIEIQRGCARGCRFCQAGMIYRPVRERALEEVLTAADELLASTGYEELSLLSFSSSDYSAIETLLEALADRYANRGLSLSLPSLRLDAFSVRLAEIVSRRRRTGLTFAPEAGTQRLRDGINKGLTEEDFRTTLEAAFSHGWQRVKLYFMVGLPGETRDDLAGLVGMVREALRIGRRYAGKRATVAVSVAPFVPKPHTPFQWVAQEAPELLEEKIRYLRRELRDRAIELSWPEIQASRLEAVLARGDRRLADAILLAWEQGARFDAWQEQFDAERWWKAMAACGLDPAFYANRPRPFEERLPWDHISCGVSRRFLWSEYRRALHGTTTPDCREGCAHCGLEREGLCPGGSG
ncbi:MAG: TIGR03960 family B12-binding radical SAM protein [Chloroflexia bacterium]